MNLIILLFFLFQALITWQRVINNPFEDLYNPLP